MMVSLCLAPCRKTTAAGSAARRRPCGSVGQGPSRIPASASEGIRNHCLRLGANAVFLKSQTRDFMDYCSELGGPEAAFAS